LPRAELDARDAAAVDRRTDRCGELRRVDIVPRP